MHPSDDPTDQTLGQQLRRALQELPDAPPAMQRAAIALWPPATGLIQAVQAAFQRIAAVLSFDSWAAPATASAMRSLRSPTRQLLFSADGRDIDLRIAPRAEAFALEGQVLGPDETGQIELTAIDAGNPAARSAVLDAMGEFHIEGVVSGTYVLTLQLGGLEIVLPPIDVGDAQR